MKLKAINAMLASMLALGACADLPLDTTDKTELTGGKEDRWNRANNPERFSNGFTGDNFNYNVEDLPLSGDVTEEGWPSTYWPTYEDSINHRWQSGELSPAEKYDAAFNNWTPPAGFMDLRPFDSSAGIPMEEWDPEYYDQLGPLANLVSTQMGNAADRRIAIREGDFVRSDFAEEATQTWFGLCHAWVPASLLEDRPLRAVEYNGVTFEVADIEALLIASYNRSRASMIGGRCNAGLGDDAVERDERGRAVDVECRDSNPGSLHVIATNFLGIQHQGFAEDRTYDFEVWNQPVQGYEITMQEEVSIERANEVLNVEGTEYIYNDDAVKLYEVRLSLKWITESHASTRPADTSRYLRTDRYHYILEVDADGKIIGGEYADDSEDSHPDFLWLPSRAFRSSVANLNLEDVRMLVEMSRAPVVPDMPTGDVTVTGQGFDIPDNQSAGASNTATASGGNGVIANATLNLQITHTYIGDLRVVLSHNGVDVTVHANEGGSADDINADFPLAGFEGVDPNGDWTLTVSDNAGQDVGAVTSWNVSITTENGTPVDPPEFMEARFEGQGGIAIPDNAPGITSSANVENVSTNAADFDLSIEVNIEHTYIGDLTVAIEHNGRSWTLQDQEGGSDDNLNRTFTLDATGNAFDGDANGTWTLSVEDGAGADVGTLTNWAVVIAHN